MPRFRATDPQTGKTVAFEWYGEAPPTEADIEAVFAEQGKAAAPAEQKNPNLGIRAGNPFAPGVSSQGTEAVSEPVMAGPQGERYMQDATDAERVQGGIATALSLPAAILKGFMPAARILGGTYLGSKAGREVGGLVDSPEAGAAVGGVLGGGVGATPGGLMKLLGLTGAGRGGLVRAALTKAARAEAPAAAETTLAQVAAKAAPKAAAEVAEAAPKAAESAITVASTAAEIPERSRVMFKMVREAAEKGHKFGDSRGKIWFRLDAKGNPVELITSGKAARLKDAEKTWVANMWGKGMRAE